MATLTTPTPTHQVLFNAKSAAGSELTSNRTVLELYGNEMPTTVYFIIQHWQKGREIEVDRILPTRNVLPLCNVHLSPVTAEKYTESQPPSNLPPDACYTRFIQNRII